MNELFHLLLDLPPQASSVARGIDTLHYVVISTTVLGALGVAAATAWFIWRYRADRQPTAARSHPVQVPLLLELGVIGGLLSLFLAFWVVGFRQYVELRTPPHGAMDVYVVAKQWMWSFAYPDGAASNGDLFVPVGRPVRLLITSRDVIHSFWVPAFRVKQDAVPGRMTFAWFEARTPGVYDLLCAEYCGAYHSAMRGRIVVLAPADYEAWKEGLRPEPTGEDGAPATSLAAEGERLAAERGCLRCHTVDGTPHLGPTWAGLYGHDVELADGTVQRADDAYLTESIMEPVAKVHRGFAPIMPSYLGVLGAGETAAIVEYIHSLADRAPRPEAEAPLAPAAAPPPELPRAPAPGAPAPSAPPDAAPGAPR